MSAEILINVTPRETRLAVVEQGMLQEVLIERSSRRGVVGNLYKGRVQRVMPGMQAAFVDIGLERAAFLHANDIYRMPTTLAADPDDQGPTPTPSITSLVHEGQEIVVQVVKDPIGTKGARLTSQISIPSRYLVFLPHSKMLGISAKIEDEQERARLRSIMTELIGEEFGAGYILRTNAEGQQAQALAEDVRYLKQAWRYTQQTAERAPIGGCIYEDLSLPLRGIRDLMRPDIDRVRVDSRETFDRLNQFAQQFIPDLADRVQWYNGEQPIFDLFGVEDEIQSALNQQVPLKSGGYLVIDQTESMTTVDVNTGSFLGQRNLEDTVYRTNLEAAQAVARHLRLRNLGGIIIIDFIDMSDEEHRRQVLRTLEKSLARDHAKTTVHDFSPLGLVEMTRKRTTDSLARQMCEPCSDCNGRGTIKTAETVCYEVFREITRAVRQFEASQALVIASPKIVTRITEEESAAVVELEEFLGRPIRFQSDEQYGQEQFDVVLL